MNGIDIVALAEIFKRAMNCGFNGASREEVLTNTGDCSSPTTPPEYTTGDGLVI